MLHKWDQNIHAVLSWAWACCHFPSHPTSEPHPSPHPSGLLDWLVSDGRFSHRASHLVASIHSSAGAVVIRMRIWAGCPNWLTTVTCGWCYLSAGSSAAAIDWGHLHAVPLEARRTGCEKEHFRSRSSKTPGRTREASYGWATEVPGHHSTIFHWSSKSLSTAQIQSGEE